MWDPLPKPLPERLDLTVDQNMQFYRLVLSDFDWSSMRVWSHVLYYNRSDDDSVLGSGLF